MPPLINDSSIYLQTAPVLYFCNQTNIYLASNGWGHNAYLHVLDEAYLSGIQCQDMRVLYRKATRLHRGSFVLVVFGDACSGIYCSWDEPLCNCTNSSAKRLPRPWYPPDTNFFPIRIQQLQSIASTLQFRRPLNRNAFHWTLPRVTDHWRGIKREKRE